MAKLNYAKCLIKDNFRALLVPFAGGGNYRRRKSLIIILFAGLIKI